MPESMGVCSTVSGPQFQYAKQRLARRGDRITRTSHQLTHGLSPSITATRNRLGIAKISLLSSEPREYTPF